MINPARESAYLAINEERDYQDARKGNSQRDDVDDNRDLGSLILLTDHYLGKAKASFAGPHPTGRVQALNDLRKVAALAVLAMERHGVYTRQAEEITKGRA